MAINLPPGFEVKPDGSIGPAGGALAPAIDPNPGPLGTSLTTTPQGGASPPQTFQAGQPMGDAAAGGVLPPWLTNLNLNPWARGAIAGAGVLAPTPTANDAAPTNMWNQRPSGVGGMPGPQVTNPAPDNSGHPDSISYPHMPWPDTGVAKASSGGGGKAKINPKTVNLGGGTPGVTAPVAAPANSPWGMIDRPNASPQNSMQGRQGAPQMGVFDLSSLFSHPAVAAAAAAHPAVQAAAASQSSAPWGYGPYQKKVMGSGKAMGPDAPVRPRPQSSTTSQGGGY